MHKINQANKLIGELRAAGHEAYYVGGCVRDMLTGMSGGDIDLTTDARPEEMKAVFEAAGRKIIETGIKHGTLTVFTDEGIAVEITTYRTEGSYSDSRHPDSVDFVRNLEEDLARRDFTINAMAMNMEGQITDLYGGREDLEAHIIRTVGEADRRFGEDALRIMRAMRFAAVLPGAFVIEEETDAAMRRCAGGLEYVSAERIFAELLKLVRGHNAGKVVRNYVDVLGVVIPELIPMNGLDQKNPYHKYDVLEHCIRAMEAIKVPEGREPEAQRKREYMKLAALLHDVGKPETFFLDDEGVGHTYGHPAAGEKRVRDIMRRLKADKAMTDRVALLVKHHDLIFQTDPKLLKKWMNRFTPEVLLEILAIKRADNFATGNMSPELSIKFDEVEAMILEIMEAEECFSLKDLAVSGGDILQMCSKRPGPWLGELLDDLLEAVIDGRLANERSILLSQAAWLIGEKEK